MTSNGRRTPRVAAASAGPAVIVVAVAVVTADLLVRGRIASDYRDLLAYFYPNHCFLGRSLASGHVPSWNPYSMGGVPFAADPQSGWMSLPAMVLYSAFRCDRALRLFVPFQAALAGLGLYWFLRSERHSRVAATVAGLLLSLWIAGSAVVGSIPFAGALAWSAVTLAAASRLVRASAWSSRVGWAVATAAAWGQIAASHLSHGLLLGTGALVAFVVMAWPARVRERELTARVAVACAALLLVAMATVNLAYFLPRIAYLPRTTLGVGFAQLQDLSHRLASTPASPYRVGGAASPSWPLGFGAVGGVYLGGVGILAALAGAVGPKHRRSLASAFAAYGAVCYLLSIGPVADVIGPRVVGLPLGSLYSHIPSRFGFGLLLAIPILAGIGVDSLIGAPSKCGAVVAAAVGVAVWVVLPPLFHVSSPWTSLLVVGLGTSAVVLWLARTRPAVLLAVPVVLAVELSANAWIARGDAVPGHFGTPLRGDVSVAATLQRGPADDAATRLGGRLLTAGERELAQRTDAAMRSLLHQVEEAQGYNPVQPLRYWEFVRAMNTNGKLQPNSAVLVDPLPQALELLDVRTVLLPARATPPPGLDPVVGTPGGTLYRVSRAPQRVTVVPRWRVVRTADEALAAVREFAFDPLAEVVLEADPGIAPMAAGEPERGSSASFRGQGPQRSVIEVDAAAPSIVLIRNVYDDDWHATVDGRDVPLLHADYVDQAVAVPAGHHVIGLSYDDPATGYGLAGTALALAAFGAAAVWLRRRERPPTG